MSDPTPDPAPDTGKGGPLGALNKKVGGVPLKWIILIGVAIGLGYWYWQKRTTSAPGIGGYFSTADPEQGTSTGDSIGSIGGSGGMGSSPATTYTSAQWAINATNALSALGEYNPSDIATALSNYLNGVPLSSTEQDIVSKAIATYGAPPEGVLPVTSATNNTAQGTANGVTESDVRLLYQTYLQREPSESETRGWVDSLTTYGVLVANILGSPEYNAISGGKAITQAQVEAARKLSGTATRTYTVQPGDTLTTIAQRFYGGDSDWQKIYNANLGIIGSNPASIKAGMTLTIPT